MSYGVNPDKPAYELHRHRDWAAIYKNGRLLHPASERPHQIELLLDELGVTVVQDPAFMLGKDGVEVADTLDIAAAYRAERDAGLNLAAELRRKARADLDRADEIEKSWEA